MKIIKIILISILIISIGLFIREFYQYSRPDPTKNLMEEIKTPEPDVKVDKVEEKIETKVEKEPEPIDPDLEIYADKKRQLNELKEINDEVKCILEIPKTHIEYPVLQAKNNEFYLRKDIYKKYDLNGSLFLDYECDLSDSNNLIIYGHNMGNTNMFSDLMLYKDEKFFKEHDEILIYEKDSFRRYQAIGYAIIDLTNEAKFFQFNSYIKANENFDSIKYVEEFKKLGKVYLTDKVKANSNLLTLSTCTYESKNARLVLIALEIDNKTPSSIP